MTDEGGAVSSEAITRVPNYGLKFLLNHEFPDKRTPNIKPTWKQLWPILPMIFRYVIYYIRNLWQGRIPVMDYIKIITAKQIYGVPIGGIGGGTIGRGFRGEFSRFALIPGMYEYNTVDADQFIITIKDSKDATICQSLLSCYQKESKGLSSWKSILTPTKCKYTGLYPRSWTEYDLSEYGINLICRQISPVVPHNYKDSSIPCAVFVWEIENLSDEQRTVTISFTFKNGTGNSKMDKKATCSSKSFSYLDNEGVVLYHAINGMPCAYALATKKRQGLNISKCLSFDPNSNGKTVWNQLKENGRFSKANDEHRTNQIIGELACGIATQVRISPKSAESIEHTLVWDMPTVNFPFKKQKCNRFYTKYFGTENATLKIVDYALKNYGRWEKDIYEWQRPVLENVNLPDWYKGALFNETYFISDGGTVWFTLEDSEIEKLPKHDPRIKYGRFAYLEGHEYRMYNTYDVHFYASFALAMNWPHLESSLQYDLRDAIFTELPEKRKCLYDGKVDERKVKNTVPHDMGDPGEEPFLLINSYPIHDVSHWRDLNTKFVLQVFRDYSVQKFSQDELSAEQYLNDMYEACSIVMEKTLEFDKDNDGLIENSGLPDQTYDTWVMTGSSSYCGGLWLAALQAMVIICDKLNKQEEKNKYRELMEKGKAAFEKKLWNGQYYKFDCSENCDGDAIMADQLCGHWYLRCSGCAYDVFPQDNVKTSLKTIYSNNVMSFCNGNLGAVNGFTPAGKIDDFSLQSEEMWTGVTYALASSMLQEGLITEGWQTAGGMYKTLSEKIGLAFNTPEAVNEKHYYRSMGYMRPLSIWSMQLAWEQRTNS